MKREQVLIANYSQKGHQYYPEDLWDDSMHFNNEKELLQLCKEWHKRSASTFGDYPFHGYFHPQRLSFQIQDVIIDDLGEKFYGAKKDCQPPSYFKKVEEDYKVWYDFIKARLPRLKQARKDRLNREKELKTFELLKAKFENK
jgi:hypothetical protein